MSTIGVIGGGAWGTALAQVQATAGRNVTIWAREAAVVNSINNDGENTPFLPGIELHRNVHATTDLSEACASEILLLVVPAQYLRSTLKSAGKLDGKTLVLCGKGIEIDTGELLSQIVREVTPNAKVAVLTGPSFAKEIAAGLPAAVTIAANDIESARNLAATLGSKTFRPYASSDVTGAEVGGAVKNVLAIACGIIAGKKYGDSARAALLTRGMSEMMRLALALGGKRETLMGMCGLGDLVLTATSMQSRNFSLGYALGEGKSLEEIMGGRTAVTEGVHTARAVMNLVRKLNIDLPIMSAIHGLLHEGKQVDQVISDLLARPLMMSDHKDLLGIISVVIVIISLVPYFYGMYRGTTKPHVFTWLLWTITVGVVGIAQFSVGGGPGAWAMIIAGALNGAVALMALKYGEKNITRSDWVMLGLGLSALPLWWFTHDPLWSVLLLTAVDTCGYVPTFRKSWMKPTEEMAFMYVVSSVWQFLSVVALTSYSLTTMISPLTYATLNLVLVAYLLIRRRVLA